VEPGHYDLYVALGERSDASLPPPRRLVLRQEIHVPEFGTTLSSSSIVVLEHADADPRNRRLNFEEQLNEPYALWGLRLTPALRSTFGRRERLAIALLVYNAAPAADGKPDVEVQYAFYRREGATETLFTRTRPELLNSETLGGSFSAATGDLPIAGVQVPLTSFPDGVYRLQITITDKATGSAIARAVIFTVDGA
jgi:hypothetical protein